VVGISGEINALTVAFLPTLCASGLRDVLTSITVAFVRQIGRFVRRNPIVDRSVNRQIGVSVRLHRVVFHITTGVDRIDPGIWFHTDVGNAIAHRHLLIRAGARATVVSWATGENESGQDGYHRDTE